MTAQAATNAQTIARAMALAILAGGTAETAAALGAALSAPVAAVSKAERRRERRKAIGRGHTLTAIADGEALGQYSAAELYALSNAGTIAEARALLAEWEAYEARYASHYDLYDLADEYGA